MTEQHKPSEASQNEEDQEPRLEKETIRDLEPNEARAEQIKGASNGACAGSPYQQV
jgi:hypothetical protein